MINLIAAVGKNLEIGLNNKLIFHIPNDLKYFKKITLNKTVVMGRKTYESIGGPLPNRNNVVLTRDKFNANNVETVHNIKDVLSKKEVFVIGGEEIYREFIPYADNIYLTEVDEARKADTYFPKFDKSLYNKEIIKTEKYNDLKYSFVIYKKKN